MKAVVKKALLNIKPYVGGKPIEEVKREFTLRKVIKLASNENPYPPSPKVLRAMEGVLRNVNRYPDGNCFYLRKALSKILKVSENHIIFGNGSDEVIVYIARAFIKSGDEVIIARPSFLIYDIASRVEGAVVKAIPLKENFRYDLEEMKKAVTSKTKVIFLGNPDNPSGWYFTESEIQNFLKGLRTDIIVFIDEAYYEYVRYKDYGDSIKLLKKHKNVIVTRTFSKMYGLAGLRIGYGIANPELIDCINRVREPFNINSVAQVAALSVLKDKKYYCDLAKKIEGQRKYLYKSLEDLNLKYIESCTNFVLIDLKKEASHITQALLRKGVIVRDMSIWGLKSYIRVAIGRSGENRKFIQELGKIISS